MPIGATDAVYKNSLASAYPFTKMNFVVSLGSTGADAAFSEISGIEATVEPIEFRQGSSSSLAPVKIPGLVKHGNISLKFGLSKSTEFRLWIQNCISEHRKAIPRTDMIIELINITPGSPAAKVENAATTEALAWQLTNAWVTKYSGTDLNALQSEVAIETIEIAYEEMTVIPNPTAG
jgi:phage tail-like protein